MVSKKRVVFLKTKKEGFLKVAVHNGIIFMKVW